MKQRNWNMDNDLIKNAENPKKFTDAYEIEIKECITDFYKSGAEFIKLRVIIPSKVDSEGNPKEYNMERQVITAGDSKGNAPTRYMGIFQSLFKLTNSKTKIGKANAIVWDNDEKAFVVKKVDQYIDLIGKRVGAFIKMTQEYPFKTINGYTKEEIVGQDSYSHPYAVRIPSYTDISGKPKETFPRFNIERFYSLAAENYGKTASEIMEGKPAKTISKLYELSAKQDNEPIILDDDKMNEYILALLKRKLEKINEEFDADSWIPYNNDENMGNNSASSSSLPF